MTNINDQVQALSQALSAGKLPSRDREFAGKLVTAHQTGRLTFNMAQWVPRLLERATDGAAAAPAIQVQGVVNLLARAKASGLKFPKLWLQLPDQSPVRITVAGDKSKTPGYVMLTDGGGFGVGRYFGKISQAGELMLGKDGYAVRDALVALLQRLSSDPAAVAAEFGHLTGHCCFCALHLTDERSVSVGYGPICADKFGVPWGARPPKAPKVRKTATSAAAIV